MMKAILAASAISLAGGAASAATMTVTATGIVLESSSGDALGLFGGPTDDLSGDAFTAVFQYDTSLGVRSQGILGDYLDEGDDGDGTFDYPITSAALTINGFTYNFGVDSDPLVYTLSQDINGYEEYHIYTQVLNKTGFYSILGFLISGLNIGLPDSLDENFSVDFGTNYQYTGQFLIVDNDLQTNGSLGFGRIAATGGTDPTTPVPLPASAWLLGAALAGFGALSIRRKQNTAARTLTLDNYVEGRRREGVALSVLGRLLRSRASPSRAP